MDPEWQLYLCYHCLYINVGTYHTIYIRFIIVPVNADIHYDVASVAALTPIQHPCNLHRILVRSNYCPHPGIRSLDCC